MIKLLILQNTELLYNLELFNNFYNNINTVTNLGINLQNKDMQNIYKF